MFEASFGFLSAAMLLIADAQSVIYNPRIKRQLNFYLPWRNTNSHRETSSRDTTGGYRLFENAKNKSKVKMNNFYIPSNTKFLQMTNKPWY